MGMLPLLFACAVLGAWTSYRLGRIPNWLTVGGFVVALAGGALAGGWSGLAGAAQGAAGGVVLIGALAIAGLAGPGDLKLAGAIGALAGWPGVGWVSLGALLLALLTALAVAVATGTLRSMVRWGYEGATLIRLNGAWREHLLGRARGRLPVALFLGGGGLLHVLLRL